MRTLNFALAVGLAASAFTGMAAADDEPCERGDFVVTPDGGEELAYEAPLAPLDDGAPVVVAVDLSGTDFTSSTVSVTATWQLFVNDFDLKVNGEGPLDVNAASGVASETASAGKVGHCSTFVVQVDNFTAVGAAESITLTFKVNAR